MLNRAEKRAIKFGNPFSPNRIRHEPQDRRQGLELDVYESLDIEYSRLYYKFKEDLKTCSDEDEVEALDEEWDFRTRLLDLTH